MKVYLLKQPLFLIAFLLLVSSCSTDSGTEEKEEVRNFIKIESTGQILSFDDLSQRYGPHFDSTCDLYFVAKDFNRNGADDENALTLEITSETQSLADGVYQFIDEEECERVSLEFFHNGYLEDEQDAYFRNGTVTVKDVESTFEFEGELVIINADNSETVVGKASGIIYKN